MTNAERFVEEHCALHQISPARRVQFTTTLTRFDAWLDGPIEQATASDVRAWMTELVTSGQNPTTVAWRLNMLRPWFRWLGQEKLIDSDQVVELRELKPPRGATGNGLPNPYNRQAIKRLWHELDERYPHDGQQEMWLKRYANKTSRIGRVNSYCMRVQVEAIIKLALYCGLRRSEIFHLSMEDMHPDNKYLVVKGKRDDHREKLREVAYSSVAREAVTEWFRVRRVLKPRHKSPWVGLGTSKRRAMDYTVFSHLLLGIGNGWAYHRLRHTCATERLRAGMALEALRDYLGHSDIAMTLRYARLLKDDIQKSIDNTEDDFDRVVGRPKAQAAAANSSSSTDDSGVEGDQSENLSLIEA